MTLIDLNEVNSEKEFWKGDKFRIMEVGLNVPRSEEDYYDYMLVDLPWDSSHLYLINVTEDNGKAGSLMAAVKISSPSRGKFVSAKLIRDAIGEEKIFYVDYDDNR